MHWTLGEVMSVVPSGAALLPACPGHALPDCQLARALNALWLQFSQHYLHLSLAMLGYLVCCSGGLHALHDGKAALMIRLPYSTAALSPTQ
jgi:hypothetical protein